MAITKIIRTANGNVKLTDASDVIQHIVSPSMAVSIDPNSATRVRISSEANCDPEETAVFLDWNSITVPSVSSRDDLILQLERDFFKSGAASGTSDSSSTTKVTSSASSHELIAANPSRKGVIIANSSDKRMFYLLGAGTAVLENDLPLLVDKKDYIVTTEAIQGIHEAGPTGTTIVVEIL